MYIVQKANEILIFFFIIKIFKYKLFNIYSVFS